MYNVLNEDLVTGYCYKSAIVVIMVASRLHTSIVFQLTFVLSALPSMHAVTWVDDLERISSTKKLHVHVGISCTKIELVDHT
jgi:hypothetical protein